MAFCEQGWGFPEALSFLLQEKTFPGGCSSHRGVGRGERLRQTPSPFHHYPPCPGQFCDRSVPRGGNEGPLMAAFLEQAVHQENDSFNSVPLDHFGGISPFYFPFLEHKILKNTEGSDSTR